MASWVKFHRSLRKGAKRAFPRSTRFIYLEIAEESREHGGVLELPPRVPLADALHDLLGGSRDEIAMAIGEGSGANKPPHLLEPLGDGDEPMLQEVTRKGRRLLVVVNFEKWNSTKDDSKDRVRKYRAKTGNALQESDVTVCNALQEPGVTISSSSPLISSDLSEGVQGETSRSGWSLSEAGRRVGRQLVAHADLFSRLTRTEIAPFVERIDRELVKLEPADVWPDIESEVDSWVTYARGKAEDRAMTPTQVLGAVEGLARTRCRERPGKARIDRERRRTEQARVAPTSLDVVGIADEIAAADRDLAAQRRKRDEQPAPQPADMAAAARGALERFKRGAS